MYDEQGHVKERLLLVTSAADVHRCLTVFCTWRRRPWRTLGYFLESSASKNCFLKEIFVENDEEYWLMLHLNTGVSLGTDVDIQLE